MVKIQRQLYFRWRKIKCWTESALVLIGTEIDKRSGAPMALLARQDEEGLRYAGGAFFALKNASRDSLRARMARLSTDRSPIPALMQWNYGMSIEVLGAAMAAVHRSSLAEVLTDFVTVPLGMVDTGFTLSDPPRLSVQYADGPPGLRVMGDPDFVHVPWGGETIGFRLSRSVADRRPLSVQPTSGSGRRRSNGRDLRAWPACRGLSADEAR